ncbi:MAG TPA: Asp/Glu racemase [Clostridiales bacterium]|nr:Asp/Glu racemase [Clostridiales bacterium]
MTGLIEQEIGEVEVINLLDDSILKDMINGHRVDLVEKRWLNYAEIASSLGVDAILSACSTVGEFAEKANGMLKTPVYRIDEAMAEHAVTMGNRISVFATLPSTLGPTVDLIRRKAGQLHKDCSIHTILVEGAYEELMKGNKDKHDNKIQTAVLLYAAQSDVLVLAQASMASAVEDMDQIIKSKLLTSPKLGVGKLKRDLTENA